MSTALPTRPRTLATRRTFVIVASTYNPKYVQGLVDHATKEIHTILPNSPITLHQVPGAFEIPVAVQEIARRGGMDAIIALGVIIEGETDHAGHVASAVTHALLDLSLKYRIPIIHEVLSVKNEEQASARCLDGKINRGTEAARAALSISNLMVEIRDKSTP